MNISAWQTGECVSCGLVREGVPVRVVGCEPRGAALVRVASVEFRCRVCWPGLSPFDGVRDA